jgi:hypothetical protein
MGADDAPQSDVERYFAGLPLGLKCGPLRIVLVT